jgi:hypothetical protein
MPLKPGHGCHMCPVCEGTGWRRRRKADAEWDAYAGIEVPAQAKAEDISIGAIREAVQAERERPDIGHAALARAERVIEIAERPESERFGWEVQWERMCANGSYAELVVALEVLRMREEARYQIVWQVVVLGHGYRPEERDDAGKVARPASGLIRLSEGRQAFLNESMSVLASLMPERIRVPAWIRDRDRLAKKSLWHGRSPAHARERHQRDEEVRRLRFEEGWKISQLQREFALSRSHVKRICRIPEQEEEAA